MIRASRASRSPTPDVLAKRPPRFVERRSLLTEERGAANASLARAIETSCDRLDNVPDALRHAQRLAEAAGAAAAEAKRALVEADALRLKADAALATARAAALNHADRARSLDAAFRVFSDAAAREAYDAPCIPVARRAGLLRARRAWWRRRRADLCC